MSGHDVGRYLRLVRRLPAGVRRDLLRVLRSEDTIRADLIRQFYARPDTRDLAEVLVDVEADALLREEVITFLQAANQPKPG